MTKLTKNPISSLLEQETLVNRVNDAQNRFRFKPFFEKYRGLNILSKILQYLLPVFSIATGTLFLSTILQDIIPVFYIAVIFSVVLIIFLEYSKNYILDIAFTDCYAGLKNYSSFLIALVLCVLSGFVSLNGVKELHSKMDTQIRDLDVNQSDAKDSLVNYYDSQIKESKKRLVSIPTAVTWQKSVDDANSKQVQNLSDEITMLQRQKADDISSINTLHANQKGSTLQASGFNLSIVIVIICLVELIILIANWFVIFYDYQTAKQAQILTKNQNIISIDSDNFKEVVSKFILTGGLSIAPTYETHSKQNIIGFGSLNSIKTETHEKPQNSEKRELNTDFSTSQKEFLEAYREVVTDLKKGIAYSNILNTKYEIKNLKTGIKGTKRISKATLQNVNRVLKNQPK